jgi:hypothetical protein
MKPAILLGCLVLGAAPTEPPVDIAKAKERYAADVLKAKTDVGEQLDKAIAAARASGDKKAVDRLLAEKSLFDDAGQLPPSIPTVKFAAQTKQAKQTLEAAYREAIKQCVRNSEDARATELVAELLELSTPEGAEPAGKGFGKIAGAYSFNGKKCLCDQCDQCRLSPDLFVLVNEKGDKVVATLDAKNSVLVCPAWKTKMTITLKGTAVELRDPNTNAVWVKSK